LKPIFDGRGAMVYTPELDKNKITFITLSHYDNLIKGPAILKIKDTNLSSTIVAIQETVKENTGKLKNLAAHLYDKNKLQSCYNVWRFMKDNIKYQLDRPGSEQIRNPARTWADRKVGVDCEDLSIFASCLFLEMSIPNEFLIVAFNTQENKKNINPKFGHIYGRVLGRGFDVVLNLPFIHPPNILKSIVLPSKN
jgi:hypothetical protein